MRERGEGARERAKVRCRRQLSDQFVDGSRCKKRCAVARDAHRLSKLVALPVSLRFLSAVSLSLSRSLSKTPLSPSLSPPQLPNLPHSTHHFREPRRALARRSPPETSPAPSGWRTAGSPSSWPVRSLFFFFFFFFSSKSTSIDFASSKATPEKRTGLERAEISEQTREARASQSNRE